MGRAIVRRPQVFLMDEPLSNLDAKLRVQMRAEVNRIQHDLGVTTLYVTHDQIEAMTMGDRVAVMSKGYLQQVDSPQHLYDHPDNLFVATFIGSPQMNLVLGKVDLAGPDPHVEVGAHTFSLTPAVLAERPALRSHDGADVVIGIRPESLEDATLSDGRLPSTIDVMVELREGLGSEVVAHARLDAASRRWRRRSGTPTPPSAAAGAWRSSPARPADDRPGRPAGHVHRRRRAAALLRPGHRPRHPHLKAAARR
jgi:multiple sugar transport system ATP-binding protein